jgi:hypothetical protein
MILTYRKGYESIDDKFKSFEDFLYFVKNNIKNLNLENNYILSKLKSIYIDCISEEKSISYSTFKYYIIEKLYFKYKRALCEEYWKERGFGNYKELVKKNRMSPNTLNYWINLGYDEENSKLKVSEFQKKLAISANKNEIIHNTRIEYYIKKGYSIEESEKLLSERQKTIKIEKYIKKYGQEEGTIIYNEKVNNRNLYLKNTDNNTLISHYLKKGYSIEESEKLLSERQKTIKIEKYIKKYGQEEGTIIYNQKIENRNSYLGCSKKGYSSISQDLFNNIREVYNSDSLYYASNNKEYSIRKYNKFGYWLFDFTDTSNNKIIEFQGDVFHANPKIYKPDDTPHPFYSDKKSKEIWIDDDEKRRDAELQNFEVYYVWESDYRKDKDRVLTECLNFLKN